MVVVTLLLLLECGYVAMRIRMRRTRGVHPV
jgi:hypothetical protein